MQLSPYVETLQDALRASVGTDDPAADRMIRAVEPAVRLLVMEAISAAATEVTAGLAGARVEVRLRGRDLELAVVGAEPEAIAANSEDSGARLTLRLPSALKARVESAAAGRSVSVNTWLVRAISRACAAPDSGPGAHGRKLTGFVRG